MKIKWKQLIIAIIIPLAVGGISAFLTMKGMDNFDVINKPPLSPPKILFPVVWTILYIMMGLASYLVYNSKSVSRQTTSALFFYGLQLIFNFFWSIIFFNLQMYLTAFIWLIIMIALIVITIVKFYNINKLSGLLMLPYLIWCIFAAYLNFGIYLLK